MREGIAAVVYGGSWTVGGDEKWLFGKEGRSLAN